MKVVPQLELVITEEISKNVSLYKRKNNNNVFFFSYKEGKADKYTNVYYLTCIKEAEIKEFKKNKLSINDIFKNAFVVFYATSNINNSDSDTCCKVPYKDLIISPDMLSLEDFKTRDLLKEEFLSTKTSESEVEPILIMEEVVLEDDAEYIAEKSEMLKIYHEDDALLYEDNSDRDFEEDDDDESDDEDEDIIEEDDLIDEDSEDEIVEEDEIESFDESDDVVDIDEDEE